MSSRKPDLYAIVADLHSMRYRPSDIARVLHKSNERIRQLLRDMELSHPTLDSVDDLPHDMRERVKAFLETETQPL